MGYISSITNFLKPHKVVIIMYSLFVCIFIAGCGGDSSADKTTTTNPTTTDDGTSDQPTEEALTLQKHMNIQTKLSRQLNKSTRTAITSLVKEGTPPELITLMYCYAIKNSNRIEEIASGPAVFRQEWLRGLRSDMNSGDNNTALSNHFDNLIDNNEKGSGEL